MCRWIFFSRRRRSLQLTRTPFAGTALTTKYRPNRSESSGPVRPRRLERFVSIFIRRRLLRRSTSAHDRKPYTRQYAELIKRRKNKPKQNESASYTLKSVKKKKPPPPPDGNNESFSPLFEKKKKNAYLYRFYFPYDNLSSRSGFRNFHRVIAPDKSILFRIATNE